MNISEITAILTKNRAELRKIERERKRKTGKDKIRKDIFMKITQFAPMIFTAPKEGKEVYFSPEGLEHQKYLVLKVKNLSHHLQGLRLGFWRKDSSSVDLVVTFGVIPALETVLAFPLEYLDSQTMFLPRTAGTLKRVVFGNKIEPSEVHRISLGFDPHSSEQSLEFLEIYFSQEAPLFPVPDLKLVDSMGQCKLYDWKGKTHNEAEMCQYIQEELLSTCESCFPTPWSEYGGLKSLKFEASGFFRTEYDRERKQWFLVDPTGYAFYSIGLDCVGLQVEGKVDDFPQLFDDLSCKEAFTEHKEHPQYAGTYYDFSIRNMVKVFGDSWWEKWAQLTKQRLLRWRFNTIGNWSDEQFCIASKLPFVHPLKNFPATELLLYRDFPDVFSTEYEENSLIFAKQLEEYKDNPYLIGYFLRNEPLWAFVEGMSLAEEVFESPQMSVTKETLLAYLTEKYKNIQALNTAWNQSFSAFENLLLGVKKIRSFSTVACEDMDELSRQMIERYVSLPSIACKKVDKNHLNLGMRYAYIWHKALLAGCEHFDVFSFNCYKMNPVPLIKSIGDMTGLPVMIGEFHFGAMDRGMMATGLKAVETQAERGVAYRYYVERSAAESYCVGTHYFTLYDQAYLGRFDGENFQIGIVDCCQREYEEFSTELTESNQSLYEIKLGKKEATNKQAVEVPRVGF